MNEAKVEGHSLSKRPYSLRLRHCLCHEASSPLFPACGNLLPCPECPVVCLQTAAISSPVGPSVLLTKEPYLQSMHSMPGAMQNQKISFHNSPIK